jgi:hypothetical protein
MMDDGTNTRWSLEMGDLVAFPQSTAKRRLGRIECCTASCSSE